MNDQELTMSQILHLFSFEESVKIAYIPVLLTKAAFRYAEMVMTICAKKKLPYVKEVRTMREGIKDWHRETLGRYVNPKTLLVLEDETEAFFDIASGDVQTLWFVINQELKKKYPELDEEYELLSSLCLSIALLRYVRKFEVAADAMMSQRVGQPLCCAPNPYSFVVWKALEKIADNHKVDGSDMINLSLKIIRNRADGLLTDRIRSYEQDKGKYHGNQSEV